MASSAAFGTTFEELEDEERDPVSKRPLRVDEQIATDEQGRRRFHGAFSGGFSAGFFNTVGSKQGWYPSEYKSSRDERTEKHVFRPEDFMDKEDLGEFGIAHRRVRQTAAFSGKPTEGAVLAWERGGDTSAKDADPIGDALKLSIQNTSDTAGVRLLKKMGWREGQGVGPKKSWRQLKRAKDRGGRSEAEVDELAQFAPDHEVPPEDVLARCQKAEEGQKGLGYKGLDATSVLSERYGQMAAELKAKKGRGIRGQAFGIGAFEDADEDIYTSVDLSQYDFALDAPGDGDKKGPQNLLLQTGFVAAARKLAPRKFWPAPRVPPDFKPYHRTRTMAVNTDQLSKATGTLSAFQRAVFLGDATRSVMEMLSDEDREKLRIARAATELRGKEKEIKKEDDPKRRRRGDFEDEAKQKRYDEYVKYVRRGLAPIAPRELSHWEWESEVAEFEERLPAELRALLPEVRARERPLAGAAIARPLATLLNAKFASAGTEDGEKTGDDTKRSEAENAVKAGLFGLKTTRQVFEWRPHNVLVKRFNIPNPFPHSDIIGCPHLAKKAKIENLENLGLSSVQADVLLTQGFQDVVERDWKPETEVAKSKLEEAKKPANEEKEAPKTREDVVDRPPMDFFAAIFAGDEDEEDDDEEEEKEKAKKEEEEAKARESATMQQQQTRKFTSVMELVPQGVPETYGPTALPQTSGMTERPSEDGRGKRRRHERGEDDDDEDDVVWVDPTEERAKDERTTKKKKQKSERKEKKARKEKKEKKESSKKHRASKKKKKRKEERSKKRRRTSPESSSSDGSDASTVEVSSDEDR